MRSQVVVQALAVGLAVWMLSSFLTAATPNLPATTLRLGAGLMATAPLFLVAIAAAVVLIRRPLWLEGEKTGSLVAGLIAGTLWAFSLALSLG